MKVTVQMWHVQYHRDPETIENWESETVNYVTPNEPFDEARDYATRHDVIINCMSFYALEEACKKQFPGAPMYY